jgi:hypothetical protein
MFRPQALVILFLLLFMGGCTPAEDGREAATKRGQTPQNLKNIPPSVRANIEQENARYLKSSSSDSVTSTEGQKL